MSKVCVWVSCLIFLIAELIGEVVLYHHSEPNDWLILLSAILNYLSVWFVIILTDDRRTDVVVEDETEYNIMNEGNNEHSAVEKIL